MSDMTTVRFAIAWDDISGKWMVAVFSPSGTKQVPLSDATQASLATALLSVYGEAFPVEAPAT